MLFAFGPIQWWSMFVCVERSNGGWRIRRRSVLKIRTFDQARSQAPWPPEYPSPAAQRGGTRPHLGPLPPPPLSALSPPRTSASRRTLRSTAASTTLRSRTSRSSGCCCCCCCRRRHHLHSLVPTTSSSADWHASSPETVDSPRFLRRIPSNYRPNSASAIKIKIRESIHERKPQKHQSLLPNLAADGEKRLAGGVHEDNLALMSRNIIVDPKNQIPLAVEHREAIAVEQQRLLPHCQDRRVSSDADAQIHSLRSAAGCSGIGIHLCHLHSPNSSALNLAVKLHRRKAIFIPRNEEKKVRRGQSACACRMMGRKERGLASTNPLVYLDL